MHDGARYPLLLSLRLASWRALFFCIALVEFKSITVHITIRNGVVTSQRVHTYIRILRVRTSTSDTVSAKEKMDGVAELPAAIGKAAGNDNAVTPLVPEKISDVITAKPSSAATVGSGGSASIASCIFNLANTVLGAGMLALPGAFADAGLVTGLVLAGLAGGLNIFTLQLISACAARHVGS